MERLKGTFNFIESRSPIANGSVKLTIMAQQAS